MCVYIYIWNKSCLCNIHKNINSNITFAKNMCNVNTHNNNTCTIDFDIKTTHAKAWICIYVLYPYMECWPKHSLFMFLATQSSYSYIWNWFTCCLCWKRRKDCQKLYAKAFFHYWTTKVSMNHLCCWSLNTIYMYVHSLITSSTTPLSHCKSYACLLTEVFINDKAKSSSDILAKEGYENLCYAAIPYTTKQRCSHMC